jgi:hypothetical protein
MTQTQTDLATRYPSMDAVKARLAFNEATEKERYAQLNVDALNAGNERHARELVVARSDAPGTPYITNAEAHAGSAGHVIYNAHPDDPMRQPYDAEMVEVAEKRHVAAVRKVEKTRKALAATQGTYFDVEAACKAEKSRFYWHVSQQSASLFKGKPLTGQEFDNLPHHKFEALKRAGVIRELFTQENTK